MRRQIFGVGVDICNISRIQRLVNKGEYYQRRFLTGTFHEVEQKEYAEKEDAAKYQYLASRWALKEAMVKATGRTDIDYKGMFLKKPPVLVEIIDGLGEISRKQRPYIEICGERNLKIFKELGIVQIHSSISHEELYAIAFITLESEDGQPPKLNQTETTTLKSQLRLENCLKRKSCNQSLRATSYFHIRHSSLQKASTTIFRTSMDQKGSTMDLMMNSFECYCFQFPKTPIMARNSKSVMPYKNESGFGREADFGRDSGFGQGFGQLMKANHDHFDKMAKQMFSGFGMGDPFENDPFFRSGGGMFGRMDEMLEEMRKPMGTMSSEMLGGGGRFQQYSQQTSVKIGPDGKPIKESYSTSTKGAMGPDGKRITERQQMYDNSGTGHQKMAHERMLNEKGRKIVQQRIGNESHQHDVYRNLNEQNSHEFDDEWNRMAEQMGFNYKGNRLGYAGNDRGAQDVWDEGRRGHYVPNNARSINAPVRITRDTGSTNDLRPTQPMALPDRQRHEAAMNPHARTQHQPVAAPLAIGNGQQRIQARQQVQPRAYQPAAISSKKPARAG